MSIFQDAYDFVSGYEPWAKGLMLTGLALAVGTAVLSPRQKAATTVSPEPTSVMATIREPQPDAVVGERFTVSGDLGEPPKDGRFWFFTANAEKDKYWPQQIIHRRPDGTWRLDVKYPLKEVASATAVLAIFLTQERGQILLELRRRASVNSPAFYLTPREIHELGGLELVIERVVVVEKAR